VCSLIACDALAAEPSEHIQAAVGPDLIVTRIYSPQSHGYEQTEDGAVSGLSLGFQLCNIGIESIRYEALPSVHHPLFRSAVYRLKDNRFEQIGIAWVYHGYAGTNDPGCGFSCTAPGNHDGSRLYPGCSDFSGPSIIAYQPNLGPASQINAHTAVFNLPVTHPSGGQSGRIQVNNNDLDPAMNSGATYYVEGHCLSSDDAAAGNGNNNASHQRVHVVNATDNPNDSCTGADPLKFCMFLTDSLYESQPAIRAWNNHDPEVVETDAQVPGEGLFILAARATDLGGGQWSYEYALHNLNSDRSGKSFSMPLPVGVNVSNVGFHDVDYYGGEPYDGTDWQSAAGSGTISWSIQDYADDPNANALRWGTLYNFRFDSNVPPAAATATVELFKPGTPQFIHIETVGTTLDPHADGDLDLADFSLLARCFGEETGAPISPALSTQCLAHFDFQLDGLIDLADWKEFQDGLVGPAE